MLITVTGIDESTDIDRLLNVVQPHAEIGILFSMTASGRNRYPSADWISKTSKRLRTAALHVCGSNARHFLRTKKPEFVTRFARIQVNGVVSEAELSHICQIYPDQWVITQHTLANKALARAQVGNHQLLVDGSGGRGVVPPSWQAPATNKAVGFAGGLGPDTILTELPKIQAVVQPGWWIDMENALRDKDDWFSIDRALAVITAVAKLPHITAKFTQ